MTARVQAVALLVLGAVLVRLASGSQLARYVRPGTRPLVLVAGVVLIGVGACCVLRSGRETSGTEGVTRAGWLLLAPVLTIAVVAPPALGVLTADRPPATPPRPSSGFRPLPATDPVPMAVPEVVLRTVWHAGSTMHGRTLRVVGFVTRRTVDGFVLARLVITCCAADARPYDIAVVGASRSPPPGTWVAVTGRYAGASAAGPVVPAMRGTEVTVVPEPNDPYE